jgi:hypothetical protein
MELTADELAGVVDLFGALTRAELRDALAELAFKEDATLADPEARIDEAIEKYHLVEVPPAVVTPTETAMDGPVLVVGPAAFPALPADADDLPHIMSVADREVATEAVTEEVIDRFEEDVAAAVEDGDVATAEKLLDVSYELTAWGETDLDSTRRDLEAVTDR